MFEPYLPVIALVGLALLLVLCLPFARIQKLVLEVTAWGLRLALVALLGAAAYLLFRPGDLPAEVADTSNTLLNNFPRPNRHQPDGPGQEVAQVRVHLSAAARFLAGAPGASGVPERLQRISRCEMRNRHGLRLLRE